VKVLHIEDCEPICQLVKALCRESIEVEHVLTLSDAKERLRMGGIDVLLVDLNLDDSIGLDTIAELLSYHLPIVVLSGLGKYTEDAFLYLLVSSYPN